MTTPRQIDAKAIANGPGHLFGIPPVADSKGTELDRIATSFRLDRGNAAFHEGDEAIACYQVVSGCVRISKLLPDGRRHVLQFAFPGDFFGGDDGDLHDATAEALVPTTVSRLSRRQLEAVAERDLAACNLLRRSAVARLAAAHLRGVVLSRLTARERLASFLLELLGRTGGRVISLVMGRADIGDYLGLTIETVSRTFGQLKAAGIIRLIDTSHVQIDDARALAALAAGKRETD
jgi:CRP-like cAMP-binding protein